MGAEHKKTAEQPAVLGPSQRAASGARETTGQKSPGSYAPNTCLNLEAQHLIQNLHHLINPLQRDCNSGLQLYFTALAAIRQGKKRIKRFFRQPKHEILFARATRKLQCGGSMCHGGQTVEVVILPIIGEGF